MASLFAVALIQIMAPLNSPLLIKTQIAGQMEGQRHAGIRAKKPIYMHAMMERLGVDPAGGVIAHSGFTYLTALHRCQACPSREACRDWLVRMPMSVSFAPRFCPNADILFELQFDQPSHIRGSCTDLPAR